VREDSTRTAPIFLGAAVVRHGLSRHGFSRCGIVANHRRRTHGCGSSARIDGVIGEDVAVEVESRVSKQVRGAVCDLIFHPFPKKLLVIVPVHMTDADICAEQCRTILRRFVNPHNFRVVVLTGSGFANSLDADAAAVREALTVLRKQPTATEAGSQQERPAV